MRDVHLFWKREYFDNVGAIVLRLKVLQLMYCLLHVEQSIPVHLLEQNFLLFLFPLWIAKSHSIRFERLEMPKK